MGLGEQLVVGGMAHCPLCAGAFLAQVVVVLGRSTYGSKMAGQTRTARHWAAGGGGDDGGEMR